MKGDSRLYYRFRYAKFYGGIITADAVGCNLLCAFCWNYSRNSNPKAATGTFNSPKDVAKKLDNMAQKHNIKLVRISGAEPFIGPDSADHVLKILDNIKSRVILETNGIYLGRNPDLVNQLSKYVSSERLWYIRISTKAGDPQLFEKVTGAKANAFENPKNAISLCDRYHIPTVISYIPKFSSPSTTPKSKVYKNNLEKEDLYNYRGVKERLEKKGCKK